MSYVSSLFRKLLFMQAGFVKMKNAVATASSSIPLVWTCSSIDKVIAKVHRREEGAILTTFDLQWHVSWVVHGYKWQCLFALLHYRPDDDSWNVGKLLSELKLVTDNLLFIYHQSNQANGSLTSTSVMDSTTKEEPLEEMAGEKQAIILQSIAHANMYRLKRTPDTMQIIPIHAGNVKPNMIHLYWRHLRVTLSINNHKIVWGTSSLKTSSWIMYQTVSCHYSLSRAHKNGWLE